MSEQPSETTEAPSPAPEQAAPLDPAPTQSETAPDMSEQVQLLQQRLERIEGQGQTQEEVDGATLADQLLGVDPDMDYDDYLYEEPEDPAYYQQQQQVDPLVAQVQAITQHLQGQEHQARLKELNGLVEEFPELKERDTQEKIAGALSPYADKFGDAVLTEPGLIRQALVAIKAEAASAAETPAEEARNRGALLESDAGARADDGASDYQSEAQRAIVEAGPPGSAFG